jgi:type I restriction enzyme R subunit
MVNDFRPFGAAMAKLSTEAKTIERDDGTANLRRIDTAYEIYLGLYQAITGPEERQKIFREFSPSFFDLIVIDECHRGSAAGLGKHFAKDSASPLATKSVTVRLRR